MCCVTDVVGLPPWTEVEAILAIAGFKESEWQFHAWERVLPEIVADTIRPGDDAPDRIRRSVLATDQSGVLHLALRPGIGSHTQEQHRISALGASIMYSVADAVARRSDGRVIQRFLRGDCLPENNYAEHYLLAEYPNRPIRHEHLCYGFREVLYHGIALELDELWFLGPPPEKT